MGLPQFFHLYFSLSFRTPWCQIYPVHHLYTFELHTRGAFCFFNTSKNKERIKWLDFGLGKDIIWVERSIYTLQPLAHSRMLNWTHLSPQGPSQWLGRKQEEHWAPVIEPILPVGQGAPSRVGKRPGLKTAHSNMIEEQPEKSHRIGPQLQTSS